MAASRFRPASRPVRAGTSTLLTNRATSAAPTRGGSGKLTSTRVRKRLSAITTMSRANSSTIPSTTIVSSMNPTVLNQPVTFTARINVPDPAAGSPTGTVQFQIDGRDLGEPVSVRTSGGVTAASISTAALPAGVHRIAAWYSGDSTFAASSASLSDGERIISAGTAATN